MTVYGPPSLRSPYKLPPTELEKCFLDAVKTGPSNSSFPQEFSCGANCSGEEICSTGKIENFGSSSSQEDLVWDVVAKRNDITFDLADSPPERQNVPVSIRFNTSAVTPVLSDEEEISEMQGVRDDVAVSVKPRLMERKPVVSEEDSDDDFPLLYESPEALMEQLNDLLNESDDRVE
jgi:hypothetical protein